MPTPYDDLSRPPLSEAELRRALVVDGSRWSDLLVREEVGSTNAELAERARAGAPDGVVLLAEHQSAGRGRLDRSWVGPPRAAITMSVLLRPSETPAARWPWLGLLGGLAVAAAVRQLCDVPAALKWPNDVVVADRKLAGILAERVESARSGPAAVLGIGLNVTTTRAELPTAAATSLVLEGASTTDRATVAKAVLRRLDGLVTAWEAAAGDSADLLAAYRAACTTVGRTVRLDLPDGSSVVGEAVGIDSAGRLLVDSGAGVASYGAGDVVHARGAA